MHNIGLHIIQEKNLYHIQKISKYPISKATTFRDVRKYIEGGTSLDSSAFSFYVFFKPNSS